MNKRRRTAQSAAFICSKASPRKGLRSVNGSPAMKPKSSSLCRAETQTEESSNFDNFKNEVQDFFPNLNGIVGEGKYVDGQLLSLEIDITTQFYGETEIIAFTQHVTDAAGRFLPQNIPVEITVESINGIESFLTRRKRQPGLQLPYFRLADSFPLSGLNEPVQLSFVFRKCGKHEKTPTNR